MSLGRVEVDLEGLDPLEGEADRGRAGAADVAGAALEAEGGLDRVGRGEHQRVGAGAMAVGNDQQPPGACARGAGRAPLMSSSGQSAASIATRSAPAFFAASAPAIAASEWPTVLRLLEHLAGRATAPAWLTEGSAVTISESVMLRLRGSFVIRSRNRASARRSRSVGLQRALEPPQGGVEPLHWNDRCRSHVAPASSRIRRSSSRPRVRVLGQTTDCAICGRNRASARPGAAVRPLPPSASGS